MKIKNLLINLSVGLLALIILELISSAIIFYKEKKTGLLFNIFNFKIIKQVDYKLNWDAGKNKLIPGVYKLFKNSEITYSINSKGFRGKEFNEEKNSKYRLISFGGSVTFGSESMDNKTYPAQLEKMFKDRNYDIEVLNFGHNSKSLNYIRQLFFLSAEKYKPDIISIYSNRNSTMYDSAGTKIDLSKAKKNDIRMKKINFFLIENIMTFRLLHELINKFNSLSIESGVIVSPYDSSIKHNLYYFTDQYKETLEEIIFFSKKNSIKVVLIKQAVLFNPDFQKKLNNKSISDLLDMLKKLRDKPINKMNYADAFWMLTNTILNKNMELLSHHDNVIIVDPINEMLMNSENFIDSVHLTDVGNKTIAKETFESLKDLID